MRDTGEIVDLRPVHERCWCYQYGRCLVNCPTADVAPPAPLLDAEWRAAYVEALRAAGRIIPSRLGFQHGHFGSYQEDEG